MVDPALTVSEALTCLDVGFGRDRRGEVLAAAQRLRRGSALAHVLTFMHALAGGEASADPFNPSRRVEQTLPDRSDWLNEVSSGYGHSLEAAHLLLTELQRFEPLPTALVVAIEALIHAPDLKDHHAAV